MDILNQIVTLMNKEEVRHFKLFTARTQVNGHRKDLQLFDYVRKSGEHYEEEKVFHKLYSGSSKNAFYRLKNRLLQDINKSLNLQHLEDDDIMHVFHLLSLTRFFHKRSKYKVALHYIRKAEKKAIKLENYELLDFIYSEMIKLSHEIIFINPEEYIDRRKENQKKLMALREIEDILAAVIYRVKMSQNFASQTDPLFDLLEKTVDEFTQNSEVKYNPKLRFTIYQAVSQILASRGEFVSLEAYLLKTYNEFIEEGLFSKTNHELKLKMLVFIINTLYNTEKCRESLGYADQLKAAMEDHGGLLHQKFLPYYYNSLIINYFKLDKEKAGEILEEAIQNRYFKHDPYSELIYITNLALFHFNANKHKKALKTLVQAKLHDGYGKVGPEFRMRIAITEITARITAGDFEVAERQLLEVRRDYKELLAEEENAVGRELIDLLSDLNDNMGLRMEKPLREKIRAFLETHSIQALDRFSFIETHDWLGDLIGHPTH